MNHVKLVKHHWTLPYCWSKYKLGFGFTFLVLTRIFHFVDYNSFCLAVVKELSADQSKQVKLGFLTGLVPREKSMAFERILFRATRGNIFLKQAVVEDPVTDPISGEKVIIIYFFFLNI